MLIWGVCSHFHWKSPVPLTEMHWCLPTFTPGPEIINTIFSFSEIHLRKVSFPPVSYDQTALASMKSSLKPRGVLQQPPLICPTTGICKQQPHLGPQHSFSLTPHTHCLLQVLSEAFPALWSQLDTEGPYDVCSLVKCHLIRSLRKQQGWHKRKGVNCHWCAGVLKGGSRCGSFFCKCLCSI